MIDNTEYTDALPTKTGWYWCFDRDYPVPSCYFLQQETTLIWKMYSLGGFATGLPWLRGHTYRSVKPLIAPKVYVEPSNN